MLDNKQLDKAKGWVEMFKCCLKIYIPGQKISFNRLFFFEVMTITKLFPGGLAKPNFDHLDIGY